MPYRKRSRFSKGRRYSRFKKRFGRYKKWNPRAMMTAVKVKNFGFPDEYMCKLKYTTDIGFSGSATPSGYTFRANSLYDPDLTSTGHQPTYYDQLSAVYTKYLVLGCAVKLQIQNQASTGTHVGWVFSESDLSALALSQLQEAKYAQSATLNVSAGQPVVYKKAYMPIGKLMGQRRLDQDPEMYAAYNANPTDVAYFVIKCASTDGVTNVGLFVHVELTFYCKFKDQYDPGWS